MVLLGRMLITVNLTPTPTFSYIALMCLALPYWYVNFDIRVISADSIALC